MQAVAEQARDERGLVWPMSIAPYQHYIAVVSPSDDAAQLGEQVYESLRPNVILDTRDVGPGVKFNDSELLGIPVRIIVGRRAHEGIVELKLRTATSSTEVEVKNLQDAVAQLLAAPY